jgi:hypothetical protein
MPTRDDYINLITSEHIIRPRFVATVDVEVLVLVENQAVLRQIPTLFDVDTAVGDQLNTIGIWVGQSRYVSQLIQNVWFTWDDVVATGWASGTWLEDGASGGNTLTLNDEQYRQVIKGKISANRWDGTIAGAYDTLAVAFGAFGNITIKDNQDMSQTVTYLQGTLAPSEIALLTTGLAPIKPCGVSQEFVEKATGIQETFVYRAGPLIASTTYFQFTCLGPLYFDSAAWIDATLSVGPTATREFKIFKNGVYFASFTFAAGATNATTTMTTAGVLFKRLDFISVEGPSVVDATAQNLAVSIFGYNS